MSMGLVRLSTPSQRLQIAASDTRKWHPARKHQPTISEPRSKWESRTPAIPRESTNEAGWSRTFGRWAGGHLQVACMVTASTLGRGSCDDGSNPYPETRPLDTSALQVVVKPIEPCEGTDFEEAQLAIARVVDVDIGEWGGTAWPQQDGSERVFCPCSSQQHVARRHAPGLFWR